MMATKTSVQPLVIEGDGGRITAVAMSEDGRRIVAGSDEGRIRVFDAVGGRLLHSLEGLEDRIGSVAITRDEDSVVAAVEQAEAGRVWLWDLDSGESRRRFRNKQPVTRSAVGDQGSHCVTVSPGHVQRWGVDPAVGDTSMRSFELETGRPEALAVSQDGRFAALGSEEGYFRVFDLIEAKAGAFVDCGGPVRAVGISPAADLALSADEDCTIRVWNAVSGDHVRALQGHSQPVDAMGVAGNRVVSISADGTARVWNHRSGDLVATNRANVSHSACTVTGAGTVVLGAIDGTTYILSDQWLGSAAEHELTSIGSMATVPPDVDRPAVITNIADEVEEGDTDGTNFVAAEGEDDSDDDDSGSDALKQLIAAVVLREARDLYRSGDYRAALASLDEADDAIRQLALWRVLRGYLVAIVGKGRRVRSPESVHPEGSFKDIDAMHFLLVREEIKEAKEHIEADEYDEAVVVLDRALQYTPHFPYANFLKALALHNGFSERASAGGLRDVVEEALRHARIGETDPEINDAAILAKVLETELDAIRELDGAGEAGQVKTLIERYGTIMEEGVGDGIESLAQLTEVIGQMRRLDRDVEAALSEVTGAEALEALRRLHKEVKRHLARLGQAQAEVQDAEKVQELAAAFAAIRQDAEKGKNPTGLLKRVEELYTEVNEYRERAADPDAVEALGNLASVIADDRRQLHEAAIVAPLAKRYGTLMESTDISSAAEARAMAKKMRTLAEDVRKAQRREGSAPGSALDELSQAIERNLEQLDAVKEPDPGIKEFNALAGEFQHLMGSVQGGISSQHELVDFLTKLADISVRAGKLRKKMKDPDGREAVDQLVETITNVVKQLSQAS